MHTAKPPQKPRQLKFWAVMRFILRLALRLLQWVPKAWLRIAGLAAGAYLMLALNQGMIASVFLWIGIIIGVGWLGSILGFDDDGRYSSGDSNRRESCGARQEIYG